MSRLSIDVSPEQHARIKALAALQGKSIKEFVLASTIGAADENKALGELEAFLDQRVERAEKEGTSTRTVEDIFRQAKARSVLRKDG